VVTLKSTREIEKMRRSGKITSRVLTQLMQAVRPGITTADLDEIAEREIRAGGGIPTFKGYNGFSASICASVNGTTLDGYVSDSAVTVPVGTISDAARRLLDVTRECLTVGIGQMLHGRHVGDIGAAVQAHAERNGYGVVRELVGHGVGQAMHEEPQVPNYGETGTGLELRPGLVLAVEPMITQGGPKVKILKDGWTVVTADGKLAAHFEHTIAVTEDGPKVLTLRDYEEDPAIEIYRPQTEAIA
jgi:methionyl aminopeptidase